MRELPAEEWYGDIVAYDNRFEFRKHGYNRDDERERERRTSQRGRGDTGTSPPAGCGWSITEGLQGERVGERLDPASS